MCVEAAVCRSEMSEVPAVEICLRLSGRDGVYCPSGVSGWMCDTAVAVSAGDCVRWCREGAIMCSGCVRGRHVAEVCGCDANGWGLARCVAKIRQQVRVQGGQIELRVSLSVFLVCV